MKTLYFVIVVLFITSCDPEQTVTFKISNLTQYDANIVLFSNGEARKNFQIVKNTSAVIFSDSGLSPESFQPNDYDSIKFSFENNISIVFIKHTINYPNDIYNGDNWVVYNKKHIQEFTYTIDYVFVK